MKLNACASAAVSETDGRQAMRLEVMRNERYSVLLLDSITRVQDDDRGKVIVAASHGGVSSGHFALEVPLAFVFFNDAGVGKDEAGIAALAMLDAAHVPAACVSHLSARIGDAQDMWDNGVLSRVNACAARLGIVNGAKVDAAAKRFIAAAAAGQTPSA